MSAHDRSQLAGATADSNSETERNATGETQPLLSKRTPSGYQSNKPMTYGTEPSAPANQSDNPDVTATTSSTNGAERVSPGSETCLNASAYLGQQTGKLATAAHKAIQGCAESARETGAEVCNESCEVLGRVEAASPSIL